MNKKHLEFGFDIKSFDDDDDFFNFEGMASTFQKDLGNDVVMKGAFQKTLKNKLPVILFQHDQQQPIGVTTEAKETDKGLMLKARLPKNDDLVKGRVIPQMKVGSLKSMSIGFSMKRDDYEIKDDTRFIKNLDLHEVSLVTFPMNTGAKVTAFKNVDIEEIKKINNKRDLETLLRDLGMSQKASLYLCSKVDFASSEEKQTLSKIDQLIWSINNGSN